MSLVTEILEHPSKSREEAEALLGQWAHVMVEAGGLLPVREVTVEDRRKLITEIRAALANASACVNIIDLAMKREAALVEDLQKKAGWLL